MLSFDPAEVPWSIVYYLQGVIERRIERIRKRFIAKTTS
jgi:hypothetical protein